eukprot:CAMPEP_0197444622 /NCGR_PEP_ID=MMETSP1175-20131217/10060_1 /TAXON_ID=1003142 /ORGANISM="Triceratium dubium, Strain CCMP147" /LENGTH=394 /DNA_ID=CAMNT_0042975443 /DNA_START=383 /DNA_END=1567 /DNA_ORIENTATION=+
MTRASLLLPAVVSVASLGISSAVDRTAAETLSQHSIPIGVLDTIFFSEVGADFGGSEELWRINTEWQWQENAKAKLSDLGVHNNFYSYLGCYNETDKSGYQRNQIVNELLQGYLDKIYVGDTSVFNKRDERTCFLASAELDVFWEIFQNVEAMPERRDRFVEIQPAGPSMKMNNGFYKAIHDRIVGEEVKVKSGNEEILITEDDQMGIDVTYCPIIKAVLNDPDRSEDITFNSLVEDVVEFMSFNSGQYVKERDFFYQAVSTGSLVPDNLVSERMQLWHDVVENVTSLTNATGFNHCLDVTIKKQMKVERTIEDSALISFPVLEEIGSKDEECIFYLVRSLANHPYICRMDLRAIVTPLPEDPVLADSASHRREMSAAASAVAAGLMLATVTMV